MHSNKVFIENDTEVGFDVSFKNLFYQSEASDLRASQSAGAKSTTHLCKVMPSLHTSQLWPTRPQLVWYILKSKISLLTLANLSGVFNTLQTKVRFEIATVFTTLILPYLDISLDHQMFNILLLNMKVYLFDVVVILTTTTLI